MKFLPITLFAIVALKGVLGWKAFPVPKEGNRRLRHTRSSKSKSDSSSDEKSNCDCGDDYFQLISEDAHARACLVVKKGKAEEGQRLRLGDCDQADQAWRFDDGLIRSKLDDNMCMQAGKDGDTPGDGTRLRLYTCDRDNDQQIFIRDHDKNTIELDHPDDCEDNLCVAFKGDRSNINRDPIVLKPCDESDGTDAWVKDWCGCNCRSDYVQIVNDDAHATACLVVKHGKADAGQKIILGDCHQHNQAWRYDDDGLFRTKLDDNMCLQAGHDGDAPEDGTELRLYPCDRHNELQRFIYDQVTIELEHPDDSEENFCAAFRGDHSNINEDPIILKPCDESDGTDNWSETSDDY